MTKVTIYSNEEVEKKYIKGTSYVARIAHDAIDNGLRIASIKSNSFFGGWRRVVELCASTIESENRLYKMKFIIDVKLEGKEVIIAFDDKCNH